MRRPKWRGWRDLTEMNNRLACTLATISLLVTACSREPAVVMDTTPRPYAPTSLERIETLEPKSGNGNHG